MSKRTIWMYIFLGMYAVGVWAQTNAYQPKQEEGQKSPTLYYAVKGGNIMARKLAENVTGSYDFGVSAGEHAFNLLFADSTLYIIDAGKQFTRLADSIDINNNTLGDGLIRAMAADGSSVDTLLICKGRPAYQDPYYGYIEGTDLYFADRNTGVFRIQVDARNLYWSKGWSPYYFQNKQLGYYSRGIAYGAINSCIGKVEGLWYWGKTYNGCGIWRFTDSDILPDTESYYKPWVSKPEAGEILIGIYCTVCPKSFVYDSQRQIFYFSLYGEAAGVYGISMSDIDLLHYVNDTNQLKAYRIDSEVPINPITEDNKGEGSVGEYIGICQMALDESTGDVYFGYRSANPEETGLYRYDAIQKRISLIPDTKGVEIYGVVIDNRRTSLFTAIQSPETGTSLSVYPNPTGEVLLVDGAVEDSHMSIYSLSGNLVLTQTAVHGTNKIDVTTLPNGLYILRLGSETFKFTKQ